jgi:hypothetical protein
MTQIVDAHPVFRRGDLAVWATEDIPTGVERRGLGVTVAQALHPHTLALRLLQSNSDRTVIRLMAAVPWANLQPRNPVPRGRGTMDPAHWGRTRDSDGVCGICNADDSMWCDEVEHRQHIAREKLVRLSSSYGAQLITPNSVVRATSEIFSVTPGVTVYTLRDGTRTTSINDAVVAFMGARSGEDVDRSRLASDERAAWSAELRKRVRATEEREHNRVLVDLEFQPWE